MFKMHLIKNNVARQELKTKSSYELFYRLLRCLLTSTTLCKIDVDKEAMIYQIATIEKYNTHTTKIQLNTQLRNRLKNIRQFILLIVSNNNDLLKLQTRNLQKNNNNANKKPAKIKKWRLLKYKYKNYVKRGTQKNNKNSSLHKHLWFSYIKYKKQFFGRAQIRLYKTYKQNSIKNFKDDYNKHNFIENNIKYLDRIIKPRAQHAKNILKNNIIKLYLHRAKKKDALRKIKNQIPFQQTIFIKNIHSYFSNINVRRKVYKQYIVHMLKINTINLFLDKSSVTWEPQTQIKLPTIVTSKKIYFKSVYYAYRINFLKEFNKKKLHTPKHSINSIKLFFFNTLFKYNITSLYNSQHTMDLYIQKLKLLNITINFTGLKNLYASNKIFEILKSFKKNHDHENHSNAYINNKISKKYNSNTKHSNYTPLTIYNNFSTGDKLNRIKEHIYFYNMVKYSSTTYKNFFIFFMIMFLENFLKKKIWIRIVTKSLFNTFWNKYINTFCTKYMYLYKRFNRVLPIREVLEIIILTFKTQDLQIFLRFLKRKFEQNHFKKHKKILSILFDILRKNRPLFTLTPIKGFSFDIRGKVGVSGNAKKRHVFFSFGRITTTSQNLCANWQQINIWTPTGQMGVTCLLQY